jgi:hypothetical protein
MKRLFGVLFLLVVGAFVPVKATESGSILDALNDMSIDSPVVAHRYWSGSSGLESPQFRNYYQQQYTNYFFWAKALTSRAQQCVLGTIPVARGYTPSAAITNTLAMVASEQQIADQSLLAWVEQNNARSLELLNTTIPRLSVEYGKIMFELSKCSGYLGGELVN